MSLTRPLFRSSLFSSLSRFNRDAFFSSISASHSKHSSPSSSSSSSSPSSPSPLALAYSHAEKDFHTDVYDRMIRVDHAGEYGAQRIYDGQLAAVKVRNTILSLIGLPSNPIIPSSSISAPVLQNQSNSSSSPSSTPESSSSSPPLDSTSMIETMRTQEIEHLERLNEMMPIYRSRPSILLPLWDLAGFSLGFFSALAGDRSAMACTVAVEEVITEHYNDQLRELNEKGIKDERVTELRSMIRKHRDDEEHHRDIGLHYEAEKAPLYSTFSTAVKAGVNVVIKVAEKI